MNAATALGMQPAFPQTDEAIRDGLTKREYFAGLAMQAIIGTSGAPSLTGFQGAEPMIAVTACNVADALLAELAK